MRMEPLSSAVLKVEIVDGPEGGRRVRLHVILGKQYWTVEHTDEDLRRLHGRCNTFASMPYYPVGWPEMARERAQDELQQYFRRLSVVGDLYEGESSLIRTALCPSFDFPAEWHGESAWRHNGYVNAVDVGRDDLWHACHMLFSRGHLVLLPPPPRSRASRSLSITALRSPVEVAPLPGPLVVPMHWTVVTQLAPWHRRTCLLLRHGLQYQHVLFVAVESKNVAAQVRRDLEAFSRKAASEAAPLRSMVPEQFAAAESVANFCGHCGYPRDASMKMFCSQCNHPFHINASRLPSDAAVVSPSTVALAPDSELASPFLASMSRATLALSSQRTLPTGGGGGQPTFSSEPPPPRSPWHSVAPIPPPRADLPANAAPVACSVTMAEATHSSHLELPSSSDSDSDSQLSRTYSSGSVEEGGSSSPSMGRRFHRTHSHVLDWFDEVSRFGTPPTFSPSLQAAASVGHGSAGLLLANSATTESPKEASPRSARRTPTPGPHPSTLSASPLFSTNEGSLPNGHTNSASSFGEEFDNAADAAALSALPGYTTAVFESYQAQDEDALQGYLVKLGEVRRNWKRRWCRLDPRAGTLLYYKSLKHAQPCGSVTLARAKVQRSAECEPPPVAVFEGRQSTLFSIVTSERTWYFVAPSDDDYGLWVSRLATVVYRSTWVFRLRMIFRNAVESSGVPLLAELPMSPLYPRKRLEVGHILSCATSPFLLALLLSPLCDVVFFKCMVWMGAFAVSPGAFLQHLIDTFRADGLPPAERDQSRRRVLTVLAHWVVASRREFKPDLVARLQQFLRKEVPPLLADQTRILRLLPLLSTSSSSSTRNSGGQPLMEEDEADEMSEAASSSFSSSPVTSSSLLPLRSVDLEAFYTMPLEKLVMALTQEHMRLFSAIHVRDLLRLSWMRPNSPDGESVRAFVRFSDRLSLRVSDAVIQASGGPSARAAVLSRFLEAVQLCLKLHNFATAVSIFAGVDENSVFRLHNSWALVPKDLWGVRESMRSLIHPSASYSAYRQRIAAAGPPCLPWMGPALSDLVFIEEGNPDLLPNTELESADYLPLINFKKMLLAYEAISGLMYFRDRPYSLPPDLDPHSSLVQAWLLADPMSNEDRFQCSLLLEPRSNSTRISN